MHLGEIDWERWTPKWRATLLFIFRDSEVLLIRKKRGLGAGKINGPGGRIEPGETPLEAAIREVQEEIGVTPRNPKEQGILEFQFLDGLSIRGYVFRAEAHEGTPVETEEATPLWVSVDALPWDEMWADDRIWMPVFLARRHFRGRFLFEGERMLEHVLEIFENDVEWRRACRRESDMAS